MNKLINISLTVIILFCTVTEALADRGSGRKVKNRTALNISTPSNIKNSIAFNLKSGLSYKGSLLNTRSTFGNAIINTSFVTYQKGNTTFIVPYKNKITMAEMRQGYTGLKIIIRKK